MAAAEWPDCGFQCNAGDVTVKELWLGDARGNALHPCNPGSQVTAYLWVRFENKANAARYAVILLADLYVGGALQKSTYNEGLCVLDVLPPKAVRTIPIYSLSWSCGQDVKLKRLILSWETAQGTSCANAKRKCSNRNTKCYGSSTKEISASLPLMPDFVSDAPKCCCDEIGFWDKTAGGLGPYTYSWDFGDGSEKDDLPNPVHRYDEPGNFTVTLEVRDSRGSFASAKKQVSLFPRPVAEAGPDISIGPGGAIRLEGSAIKGVPPYDFAWSPEESLDDPSLQTPLASPKKTTVYSLFVRDAHGCNSSDTMTLYVSSINSTCRIVGQNVSCEDMSEVYNPQIDGEDIANVERHFTWLIDGSEVEGASDNGSIEIDWSRYEWGYHLLQMKVDWIDNQGRIWETSQCEMKVLVVKVPSADIELDTAD